MYQILVTRKAVFTMQAQNKICYNSKLFLVPIFGNNTCQPNPAKARAETTALEGFCIWNV